MEFTYENAQTSSNFIKTIFNNWIAPANEIATAYFINPTNHTVFRKTTKKSNVLFNVTNEGVQKIEFGVTARTLEPNVYIN